MAVGHFYENVFRLVLVGKTGVGKSAAGNAILCEKHFESVFSDSSVTKKCKKGEGEVAGRHVVVVDTPGLFQTEISNEEAIKEIVKCIQMSFPGPHVFLLVLKIGRVTEEEMKTVHVIQEIFGERALKYMMVLFTHMDILEDKEIKDFVTRCPMRLKQLIESCSNRYHVINIRDIKNQNQAKQLLEKIDKMVQENSHCFLSSELYEQEERHRKEIEDIRQCTKSEIQKMQQEQAAMEIIMKRHEENIKELNRAKDQFIKKQGNGCCIS